MFKLNEKLAIIYYYCPVLKRTECLTFENRAKSGQVAVKLRMPVITYNKKEKTMDINFYAKPFWKGRSLKKKPQLAVCTVMPYLPSVPEKVAVQGAILFEWTRYHLALGFKVVIYDRYGSHKQDLFNEYNRKYNGGQENGNKSSVRNWENLIYHNYTMLQVIDRSINRVTYDNTEAIENKLKTTEQQTLKSVNKETERLIAHAQSLIWQRMHITDLDKILTLSHCRMELDTIWGIGNVLASDPDEFVHCSENTANPGSLSDPESQYIRILKEVNDGKAAGRASIRFVQKQPTNATKDYPLECVKKRLIENKSILSCWSSKRFLVRSFAYKTLSLGFDCPVTHFHDAHSMSFHPREFDCGADPLYDDNVPCNLIHLVTTPTFYRDRADSFNKTEVRQIKGELYAMTSMY